MDSERRWYFGKVAAVGVGIAAALKGVKVWAKGLPSDPGAAAGEAGPGVILLPPFEKNGTVTLEQALLERKTERSFDKDRPLTKEELSRLFWAMTGVNRDDGHRTTPSAVALYPVDVYVALPDGVYEFDNKKHRLVKVLAQDIRSEVPIQPEFRSAGMIVLYVANKSRFRKGENPWADLEIGCMVQNTYLQAAALGLSSCVFALVRYDNVTKLMGLKSNQALRIAQVVGHRKA